MKKLNFKFKGLENQMIFQLWEHISYQRRSQLAALLVLMIFASIAESFSIGMVIPFLMALSSPQEIFNYHNLKFLFNFMGISNSTEILLPLTILFAFSACVAGFMRLLLVWASSRLSFRIGADLSLEIYRKTLLQPYSVHCRRNSSEIIATISAKSNDVIYYIVMPLVTLISSSFLIVAILISLIFIGSFFAIAMFAVFAVIYAFIIYSSRSYLLLNSNKIAKEAANSIKAVQEGLGGIRQVLIDGTQDIYCETYKNADLRLRKAQASNFFISSCPRFLIESFGMVLIAFLAYILSGSYGGVSRVIPILGGLALGAQRVIPILQQMYSSFVNIQGASGSLSGVLELLNQKISGYKKIDIRPLTFQKQIEFKNIFFEYDRGRGLVLKNINLKIHKGEKIGLIGKTGSGKSTLSDIFMGFLQPTQGNLIVDGKIISTSNLRSWQLRISQVPQMIFLADCSIEENIALGVPKEKIDASRVRVVAKKAQLDDLIESWPEKYRTVVGERGILLSGGQRQRIGIARALYKQSDIIVFDEATSSLDNKTEQSLMDEINSLGKKLTILIVAHRVSTLRECNRIIELSDGGIIWTGTYDKLLNRNKKIEIES